MIHPIRAMKAKLVSVGLLLVGVATVGMPAFASTTATTNFTVTATVQATCTIAATAMTFATAYTGAANINATSTVTATCTNTTPYTIGLNAGTTTGATTTNRLLAGPSGATLKYQLYSDSGYTTYWGNATNVVSGTGNGSAQALTVYGQILSGQLPAPGTYTDTVTATITY